MARSRRELDVRDAADSHAWKCHFGVTRRPPLSGWLDVMMDRRRDQAGNVRVRVFMRALSGTGAGQRGERWPHRETMICMERDDGLYSEYREATQTRGVQPKFVLRESLWQHSSLFDDDDVYYHICWRLKLEGETENMGVCTKERKGVTAGVLMATPCTQSLGGESRRHKHEG